MAGFLAFDYYTSVLIISQLIFAKLIGLEIQEIDTDLQTRNSISRVNGRLRNILQMHQEVFEWVCDCHDYFLRTLCQMFLETLFWLSFEVHEANRSNNIQTILRASWWQRPLLNFHFICGVEGTDNYFQFNFLDWFACKETHLPSPLCQYLWKYLKIGIDWWMNFHFADAFCAHVWPFVRTFGRSVHFVFTWSNCRNQCLYCNLKLEWINFLAESICDCLTLCFSLIASTIQLWILNGTSYQSNSNVCICFLFIVVKILHCCRSAGACL